MRLLLAIPSGSRQEEFVHSPGRVNADRILEHAMVENGSVRMSSQFGPTVRTEFGPTPVGQATSSLGG